MTAAPPNATHADAASSRAASSCTAAAGAFEVEVEEEREPADGGWVDEADQESELSVLGLVERAYR